MSIMTNKKFDQVIREKLNEVSPSAEGEAWSLFETARNDHENAQKAADNHLDRIVRDRINFAGPGFNRDHWREMKYLLAVIKERRQTIVITRFLEFAAVLLLIITFNKASFLFEGENKPSRPLPGQNGAEYALASKSKVTHIKSSDIRSAENRELKITDGIIKPEFSRNEEIDNGRVTFVKKDEITSAGTPENISGPISTPATTVQDWEKDSANRLTDDAAVEIPGSDQVTDVPAAEVSLNTEILPMIFPQPESEMALVLASPFDIRKVQSAQVLLSAYASGDINLINTPFDKLYSLASYNKEALNKSFGVAIAHKKGNLELETGLAYASREYQPRIITEPYGQFAGYYFEKSLNKIKYDIASVPLQLKYHILGRSSASIYVMAGVTLNLIAKASYDINEVLISGRPDSGRILEDEARLDEKPFIRGVLNGDKLSDNYFVSAGFGVGVETKLSARTSAYIQPSYNRHILSNGIGIGPNKDKIHTSSLQIGIRTAIN